MKNWVNCLIGTVVFGLIYTLMEYLFFISINWRMVIGTTIIYGVLNTIFYIIANKTTKKK